MSDNNRILLYQELIKIHQKINEDINEILKKDIFKHDNIFEILSIKQYLNNISLEIKNRIKAFNVSIKQEEEVDKIFIEQYDNN